MVLFWSPVLSMLTGNSFDTIHILPCRALGQKIPLRPCTLLSENVIEISCSFASLKCFTGIIPRSIVHIFEGKTAEEDEDTMYDVRVSYIEIYNEEIR